MTQLGQFLKAQIEAGAATKEDLATAAGITVSTLGQIIRGSIKRPPQQRLEGFARVLKTPVSVIEAMIQSK